MAKLFLKFEAAVLKEFSLPQGVVTIGRLPDSLIQIDNLAVSGHHAKIYWETDHYVLEDNNSLNGTFVNNRRVSRAVLKDGDEVLVGKHTLAFQDERREDVPGERTQPDKAMPMVPTLDSTVVLDTKKSRDMLARPAAAEGGDTGAAAAPAKERIGVLNVVDGKTNQRQYVLTGKLTVVGKSDMASVKLRGWFAPKVAAVINRRDHTYFIAASEKDIKVKINSRQISGQQELSEGDMVEIAGVKMTFAYGE